MKIAGVEVPPEVVTLVLEGKKIQAIKIVRQEVPSCGGRVGGLKKAKEFVDIVEAVTKASPEPLIFMNVVLGRLIDCMDALSRSQEKAVAAYSYLRGVLDALKEKEGGHN